MKELIQMIFGYTYLANTRSKEIHLLTKNKRNCKVSLIAKDNRKLLTKRGVKRYLKKGYNGCRWCLKELDKG